MKIRNILAISAVTILSAGCASQLLSDDRLANSTAAMIGVPANELTVSGRNEVGGQTYYKAKSKAGVEYDCMISGGNFATAGMIQGAQCNKKGYVPTAPIVPRRASLR